MSKPALPLPDVQSEITRPARAEVMAGIDHVKALVHFQGTTTPATVRILARIPEGHRGVHMSRLYRVLLGPSGTLNLDDSLEARIHEVAREQETRHMVFSVSWEQLVPRVAPVTGSSGLHPIRLEISGEWTPESLVLRTRIQSAAMMACPCSKALSEELGFHNQRGILQAEVDGFALPRYAELLDILDASASNRVHPVLRREDEKEVIDVLSRTNSFRFVEDAATRLLDGLDAAGFQTVSIHVRSQESIHAHDAVAWAGTRGEFLSEGIVL